MTDDPREILREAGVECDALDLLIGLLESLDDDESPTFTTNLALSGTLLALARLVAKYKWQRNEAVEYDWKFSEPFWETGESPTEALDRLWEERDA